MRKYDPFTIGTLVSGLLEGSTRVYRAINGHSLAEILLMRLVDNTNWLVWSQTEDAQRGGSPPRSVFEVLDKKETTKRGFESSEDFEQARLKLLEKINGN